jgi:hypothetical protein
MKDLIKELEYNLKNIETSYYITAVDSDGDKIQIRTSNHSSNDHNNNGGNVISFITKRNFSKSTMNAEFLMQYDEEFELFLDSERNSIEEILSDYCLVGFYKNNQLVKF